MSGELFERPRDEVGSSEEGEKTHKQGVPQGEMSRVTNIEMAVKLKQNGRCERSLGIRKVDHGLLQAFLC